MIRIREGILLTHVCDQAILVSSFDSRKYCPYTTNLNDTGESIWKYLSEGKDIKEITSHLKEEFDIPKEVNVEALVKDYIDELHKNGYVLYEED